MSQGKFSKVKNLVFIEINGIQFASVANQINFVFYIQCVYKSLMYKPTNRTLTQKKTI